MSHRPRVLLFSLAVLIFLLLPSTSARSQAPSVDPADAAAFADELADFTTFLTGLDNIPQLNQPIPMTDMGIADLLGLSPALNTLNSNLDGLVDPTLGDVHDTLNTSPLVDSIVWGQDGNVIMLDFTLSLSTQATPEVAAALDIEGYLQSFQGGSFPIDLSVSAPIKLAYDPDLPEAERFYLRELPTFNLDVGANGVSISQFANRFGFAETLIGGTVDLHYGYTLDFLDPDGLQPLTRDEWTSTALFDLLQVAAENRDDDTNLPFEANLNLNASQLGLTGATLRLHDPNLEDGLQLMPPDFSTLGDLRNFLNVSGDNVLAGVAQFAAGLEGMQYAGDLKIPFVQGYLTDAFKVAEPFVNFVSAQGDADIVCGSEAGVPPVGDIRHLGTGDEFYCQAYTADAATGVNWTGTGVNITGINDDTADVSPGSYVTIEITAADYDFKVEWNDSTGQAHSAVPRFETAGELVTHLQELAGIGASDAFTVELNYDSTGDNLLVDFTYTADPASQSLPLDFGDKLEQTTGLIGLQGTASASASVDPADVVANVSFGVSLKDGVPMEDRYFLLNDSGEPLFEAGASATATIDLQGQVGFLSVHAGGDPAVNGGTAFAINAHDGNDPMLRVDLLSTATYTEAGDTVANAIAVKRLLADLPAYVEAECNVDMSAGLGVEAYLSGSVTPTASASFGVQWTDVFETDSCVPNPANITVSDDADFQTNFAGFNPSGSLFGEHEGAGSTTELSDSTTDFTGAGRDLTGALVYNRTDGSSCTISTVNTNSVVCNEPLSGGEDNTWQAGDRYKIEGDPLALLGTILDSIELVVANVDDWTGGAASGALDEELPLVGVSGNDLLGNIKDIKGAIENIRTATPDAIIYCGTDDSGPLPTGTVFTATVGTQVYCRATTVGETNVSSVNWSMNNATAVSGTTDTTTVGAVPSTSAVFELTTPGGYTETLDFGVQLSFNDDDGDHNATYPSTAQPQTVQALEQKLESELGIDQDRFTLDIADIGSNGVQDLVIRLDYGVCTDTPGGNQAINACDPKDKKVDPLEIPMSLDIDGAPAMIGVDENQLYLEYAARANLHMALPLQLATPTVQVLGDSGIALEAGAAGENLNLSASVGPVSVLLGEAAVFSGTVSSATVSDTTWITDTTVAGTGAADFDAIWVQTGDIIYNADRSEQCEIITVDGQALECEPAVSFAAGDTYTIGGNGYARMGASFTVNYPGGTAGDAYDVGTFIGGLNVNVAGIDKPCPDGSSAPACAAFSMAFRVATADYYLGELGFVISDPGNLTGTEIVPSANTDLTRLNDLISGEALDWALLWRALPGLIDYVAEGMDGAAQDINVPIVGDALDGGADAAILLNDNVVTPLVDNVDVVSYASDPTTLANDLGPAIDTQLGFPAGTTTVTLDCGGGPCGSITDVDDLRVEFTYTEQVADADPQFDLGVPGIPLRASGALSATVDVNIDVGFGISRDLGPYLVAYPGAELSVASQVGIGAHPDGAGPDGCAQFDEYIQAEDPEGDLRDASFSDDRCLIGVLSFLQVTLRDGDGTGDIDSRTALSMTAGLDFSVDSGDRIGLQQLTNNQADLDLVVDAGANVDLRVRTGINADDAGAFPSVVGTFHLDWGADITAGTSGFSSNFKEPPVIAFDNLHLDVGEFVGNFLAPITKQINKITGPFMPVIDTLRAPLPVLSDLSKLTGGDDITLISLLEVATGADLTLVNRILDIVEFADKVSQMAAGYNGGPLWIPLGLDGGAFNVSTDALTQTPNPGSGGDLILPGANSLSGAELKQQLAAKADESGMTSSSNFGTEFTKGGLTFPFLDQPTQIFGLIMGQDATLIRYDFGTMKATAGVSYTFRFAIGPVPMSVTIAGSVTLEGRFAIGYDTYGIRQLVEGGNAGDLLDGLFIDDLDAEGNDVPEVRLVGTVSARAAVDLVVVSAGVGGGIELTFELDLDDRPNPDGKLRMEEIVNKLANPWCLFEVRGKLEAFFEAFVKIDFFFTSKTWTYELARVTLLEFSAACEPPEPQLAHYEDSSTKDKLILNIGPHANKRNILEEETAEEIVVREIMTDTRVSIAGFGYYQEFEVHANTLIWGDGGDDNDNISLEPGVTLEGNVVGFHLRAEIYGGTGDDRIRAGEGNDKLFGGDNNDEITAGPGNDEVSGGSGSDALEGGFGNDKLQGGSENDRISGGPGSDRLYGDGGDDTLTGGPGEESGASADLADWLFGGDGADTITGGWGNDIAFGGADNAYFANLGFAETSLTSLGSGSAPAGGVLDACDDDGGTDGGDIINGDAGDDILFGDAGRDEITGGGGNDLLCGNDDDDILDGDDDDAAIPDGNDDLYGGSGNDEMTARGGSDDLFGGPGHDDLSGGGGRDRLSGEAGVDILVGDEGTIAAHNDGSGNHRDHSTDFDSDGLRALVTAGESGSDDTTLDCTSTSGGDDRSDCLDGGDHADYIWGEQGRDTITGGSGGDFLFGNGDDDYMEGNAGADTMRGGLNADEMHGGSEVDTMFGDSGTDLMYGDDHGDIMRGGIDADEMYGGNGDDQMHGDGDDDYMEGNADSDDIWGGAGHDDIIGGSSTAASPDAGDDLFGEEGTDVILGDNGTISDGGDLPYSGPGRTIVLFDLTSADTTFFGGDTIEGNGENDALFGGGGIDTMNGNGGDDYMEGNGDGDYMYGDAGQDDMIGGSSVAASLDGGDTMEGNGNQDVMLGDNGTISRPGGSLVDGSVMRSVFLHDLDSADTTLSGGDTMNGNHGPDDLYGGGAVDTIHGDDGDDYAEGNNDGDNIFGDAGQDDLIGGTEQDGGGHLDGADTIYGGDGAGTISENDFDVILGDNGRITRTADGGDWETNTFNASVKRTIRLFDVSEAGDVAPAGTAGGDFLYGEANYDVMYGQGGDDTMEGNGGDDYMEGNAADDTMDGNEGNDDMVGGTGAINDDPANGVDGRYDGVDTMHGNDGFDVMAGDNAVIRRTLDENGQWQSNSYNDGIQHDRRILRDLDSPDALLVSAGDFMWGDAQDDLMYGQGGDDEMHGGSGDDEMEGNADGDIMNGNEDDDDMVGGTTAAGLGDGVDTMHGNAGTDVLLGDNGAIRRPLEDDGTWQVDPNTNGERRDVLLYDVLLSGDSIDVSLFGGDEMYGDEQSDQLFGQGGKDEMHGGAADDYLEGNQNVDTIYGDGGEDDIIGGGSSNTGVITAYRLGGGSVDGASQTDIRGDGLIDAGDILYGDDGDTTTDDDGDVIAGDNARITRTTAGNDTWQLDPNAGGNVIRDIWLFDVIDHDESLAADINGSDVIYGEGGRDLLFGQADDESDDDGDGLFNEDPADGVDNDRDGRELAGDYYDCEDGRDNDGDGLVDAEEASCTASVDEDGTGDTIYGGDGDDYIEGNHGSDLIYGDAGQDDITGGNSAGDGHIGGGVMPFNLADAHDTIRGGSGDDNITGDNAVITRPVDGSGIWLRLDTYGWDMVVRDVVMADFPEEAGAYGHDYLLGNSGNDDMYGQMGDDYMEGNAGEDAMVGDLGLITNSIEDGSREEIIQTYAPFMVDTIYPEGSLYRLVELYSFEQGDGAEGDDTMLGNDGNDSMHGAAGDDIMNGNADEDHLFGGDDDDVMWGGTGHDHLWGGYHDDYMDVFPREEWFDANGKNNNGNGELMPADPPEWFTYGRAGDNFEGYDVIYGGWDRDAMQANIGGPGPQDGDRLLDWVGAYNVYYVCPGAYGEGYITRMLAPNLFGYLETLAQSDGALDTATPGTSGYRELAMVYHKDAKYNTHPPHPENPGHFTCTGGVTTAAPESFAADGNVVWLPITTASPMRRDN